MQLKTPSRLRRLRVLDAIGCSLAVAYGVPSVWYPFGNDQGLHWYIGDGILRGELPYVNGISGKPPGIFLAHTLAIAIFGDTQASIRILEVLGVVVLGLLVALCAIGPRRRLPDGAVGAAALAVSAVNFTYTDHWNTAHPEFWESLLLMAAAAVALHDARPVRRPFLSGLLCAMAFMFKYTAAVSALVIAAWCGWLVVREGTLANRTKKLALAAAYFLLGVSLVFVVCILPFLVTDNLGPMWEIMYKLIRRYRARAPELTGGAVGWFGWRYGGTLAAATALAALGGLAVAYWQWKRHTRSPARWLFLLALLLASVINVVIQGRFFTYHWIVIFPFAVLLMVWLLQQVAPARGSLQLLAIVALTLAAFLYEPKWSTNRYYSYRAHLISLREYLQGKRSRSAYIKAFRGKSRHDAYRLIEKVGLEIRARARPGDTLCVRGFSTPIYQLSRLRCPSRHVAPWLMNAGYRKWRAEYRRDLRKNPPTFIVTFLDRKNDVRMLRRRGYKGRRVAGEYLLMTRREKGPIRATRRAKPRKARSKKTP